MVANPAQLVIMGSLIKEVSGKSLSVMNYKHYIAKQIYAEEIQVIHKRTVRFQKLTRNLFLTLHGHSVRCQQRQLSNFLMRY